MKILPLDKESAKNAAEIKEHLKARGRTCGMADALIAGICVKNSAVFLTRNSVHFRDIPRLTLGTISTEL